MIFSPRYGRQINLQGFGAEAQQKLQNAKVLVVGAGGLGVPALQYLAGMGIGTIGIVDGDIISKTNLNRQVLYYEAEVGKPKAEVAAKKLTQQNPSITVTPFNAFLTVDNAIEIIQQFDLVIDATDNFSVRYMINDACVVLRKPFIYGAIQQYEGHVSVFNFNDGPTYRCLYPDPPSAGEIPDCNTAGVLGVVPGIIGCHQALEAVKIITGIGKPAAGFLRIYDLLNSDYYEMKLKARPENKEIRQLQQSYEDETCASVPLVDSQELYSWLVSDKEVVLVDVREQEEYEQAHLHNSLLKPLSAFGRDPILSRNNLPVVTYCQKGSRSLQAAKTLLENNSEAKVYSLVGGMDQWLKEIGNKLVVS